MIDWQHHRLHRQQVVHDRGQWLGLADENGVPLMTLPPAIELAAPETRLNPESLQLTLPAQSPAGVVHPAVGQLIAEGLGRVDAAGKLTPYNGPTRFAVVERAGHKRRAYRITHTVVSGASTIAPSKMKIHGTDMLRMLSGYPAMSAPTTWTGEWRTFTRDWIGPENTATTLQKPRDLMGTKLVQVADGVTLEGPAEDVIRRLITRSLAAAFRVTGQEQDPPLVVDQTPSGHPSDRALIRPSDKPIWDEINHLALAAGIRIRAAMWWPGDDQPTGLTLTKPTNVITVDQGRR